MNTLATENQRPGTAGWQLERPATRREIEGYASATSVNRGEAIRIYVNTSAPSFTLEVFRMGWYQGLGARRVFGPVVVAGTTQPMPAMDPQTGLVDCAWVDPFELQTAGPEDPAGWPSGVYLAKLTESRNAAQSYVIFVARDDQRRADLLFQLSVTTYQAYNTWGGKSLYHWGSIGGRRALKVSFNRPYAANAQNPAAACGVGAGEFLTNLQPHPDNYKVSNAAWDYNMLRWLEREGYDLVYGTNLDTDAGPDALLRCKAWLSVGHDEYWSAEMRRHVEAARDAGVHLAFFSANTAYWKVRFEASAASGTAHRIMVCHKKAASDPLGAAGAGLSYLTGKWRSAEINRPEAQLIGVMYRADPVDADIVVKAAQHWVFAGTGLHAGAHLPGLLGYEVDAAHRVSPASLQILAESPWAALTDAQRQGIAHMSIYSAESGALVFAAGTIQWAWGLDDHNAPALRTSRLSPAAQRITRNLLDRFVASGGVPSHHESVLTQPGLAAAQREG